MNTIANIQALLDFCGPNFEKRPVTIGAKLDADGNPIKGTGITREFFFKRLSSLEADALRTHALGADGKVDRERFKGNNARTVAACVVDADTFQPLFTIEEVESWKAPVVDAMALVANEVNSLQGNAVEVAEGNSIETPSDGSSLT